MNIIKSITLLLTLLIVILMTGCSQEKVLVKLQKYIDKMNSGDYETAYSLLSKDSKKKLV